MPRLTAIDPATATGEAKALLDGVQKKLGMAPNIVRTMANSPTVLKAFLGFGEALSGGRFDAKSREAIALAVDTYLERPEHFRAMQRTAMHKNMSWDRAASQYDALYRLAIAQHAGRLGS